MCMTVKLPLLFTTEVASAVLGLIIMIIDIQDITLKVHTHKHTHTHTHTLRDSERKTTCSVAFIL